MVSLSLLSLFFVVTSAAGEESVVPTQAPPADAGHHDQPPARPGAGDQSTAELERRIDVVAGELEKLRLQEVLPKAEGSVHGLGPAASKVYRSPEGVSLGGYGEMLYRNFHDPKKSDVFDFLRGVLYAGYKFSDKFVLNTEIEIEHAREISLEFAYVDFLWRPELSFRGGIVLLPMGHINELHEPTTFLGATRPDVEQRILPTTWRENGLGVFGEVGPIAYRAYLVNGLRASGFTAQGLRGGRQKGAEAIADDFAGVARVDYTGVPGLLAGVSAYYGASGQQLVTNVPTVLYEAHVDYKWRGLQLRGLFARSHLQNVAALNEELSLTGAQSVGEELQGWYAQAGYDVLSLVGGRDDQMSLTPFARWEDVDTQVRVPSGFESSLANSNQTLTLGADFQPISALVVKAEFQRRFSRAGGAASQVNVLLGYIF